MSATPKTNAPQGSEEKAAKAPPRPPDPEILERVKIAAAAALDKKALDLKVLHLGAVTHFTEFFLLASGSNERQVQAIVDAIVDELRKVKVRPLHDEGSHSGGWVLIDYGDFVCHIFDQQKRSYYALERLWDDAPDLTDQMEG